MTNREAPELLLAFACHGELQIHDVPDQLAELVAALATRVQAEAARSRRTFIAATAGTEAHAPVQAARQALDAAAAEWSA